MKEPLPTRTSTAPHTDPESIVGAYAFDLLGYHLVPSALKSSQYGWIRSWEDLNCPCGTGGWINQIEFSDATETERRIYRNVIEGGEVFEALMDHSAWHPVLSKESCQYGLTLVESEMLVNPKSNGLGRSYLALVIVILDDLLEETQIVRIVPGSHRTKLDHPSELMPGKWDNLFVHEVALAPGDALILKPGLRHSFRVSATERIRVLRLGYALTNEIGEFYAPSPELLDRLTPPRRALIGRLSPRTPPTRHIEPSK